MQLFFTILFVIMSWNVCLAELQIYDDFDGSEINTSLWNKSDSGVLSQANGYLLIITDLGEAIFFKTFAWLSCNVE